MVMVMVMRKLQCNGNVMVITFKSNWPHLCSQCWYISHDPSSLFHCSVLVGFSVSMMVH